MPVATINTPNIELESTLRPTGLNGAPTSEDYNNSEKEKLRDLATITELINTNLLPLLNSLSASAALPSGSATGVQGSTVFTDSTDQSNLFFDAVNGNPLTIADSFRVLNGIISNLLTSENDLSVRVDNLSTSLSTTGQNDISSAISGLYELIAIMQSEIGSLQASVGNATATLGNFQSGTVRTASIFPKATDSVDIIWGSPFLDDNYVVSYALRDDSGMLQILNFSYISEGVGISVRVKNSDNSNSWTGYINVTARAL